MEKRQDRGQEVRAMWRALFVLAAIPREGTKTFEQLREQLEVMLHGHGLLREEYLEPNTLRRDLEELEAIFGDDSGGLLHVDRTGKAHRYGWSKERDVLVHPADAARALLSAFREDWETTVGAKRERRG